MKIWVEFEKDNFGFPKDRLPTGILKVRLRTDNFSCNIPKVENLWPMELVVDEENRYE